MYVYYTFQNEGESVHNRLSRFHLGEDVVGPEEYVLERITTAGSHNGGTISFGPDGKLYVLVGDESAPRRAQEMGYLAGKVLRLNPDGTIPADNPFPDSPVYTLGHRNMIGIDFHPATGIPVITENGDRRDDEVNILVPGGNYGWPVVAGVEADERFVDPVLTFTPNNAPTGAAFYTGTSLPDYYHGGFFFGDFLFGTLHYVEFTEDLAEVTEHETALRSGLGILSVVNGPDGHLYFSVQDTIYRVVAIE